MKELDNLVENTFKVKRNNKKTQKIDLIALVEAALDEVYDKVILGEGEARPTPATKKTTAKDFLISLPKFSPNESWGDPNSVDRQTVNKIFSVVGGGATVEEKLKFIQKIADPGSRIRSPRRIISTLIILESLSAAINSFSASAAGFVFEGFLSALFRGRQEAEYSEKGNLPIQDLIGFSEIGGGTPISLKLLNQTTNIHGSYTNLVDALDEFGSMVYLVARKDGDEIALEQFVLDRDNFIDAITTASRGGRTKEKNLFRIPGQMSGAKAIDYINDLDSWPDKFRALQQTAGYRGDTSREATPNEEYDQKKESARKETFENHWAHEDMIRSGKDPQKLQAWFFKHGIHKKLGLDPDDNYPTDPKEARIQDTAFIKGLADIHGNDYYRRLRYSDQTPAEWKKEYLERLIWSRLAKQSVSEVTHQAEPLLTEAKGSQWSISPAQLKSLQGVNYEKLGTLPYSSEKIEKIAEMHMDKLNDSLLELFESTKALSDNINNYFTYEERDRAIKSGETAIEDTLKIQDSLRTELSQKDED